MQDTIMGEIYLVEPSPLNSEPTTVVDRRIKKLPGQRDDRKQDIFCGSCGVPLIMPIELRSRNPVENSERHVG